MFESLVEEASEDGTVSYSVDPMNECSHEGCDSRREFGVNVTKVKPRVLLGLIRTGKTRESKVFCPKHRDSVLESREARQKQHEYARKEWRKEKKSRRIEQVNKMIESEILPTFKYKRGVIFRKDGKFEASGFDNFEQSLNYIQSFDSEIPLLAHTGNEYALVFPSEGRIERHSVKDGKISYQEFSRRFSDVEFADREFYPIKTNCITGMDSNQPVHKFEEHIDQVLEWKEYDEPQGHLDFGKCELCDSSWTSKYFSRAIRDGNEVIIVSHKICGQIMGEINRKMIDEESYDIDATKS